MPNTPLIRGRAMRATKVDSCGKPKLGPRSTLTTKGFITVGLTPNLNEGEAITQTNAAGEQCINDTPIPQFQDYTVAITFCGVNPELLSMMTGQKVVMDAAGTSIVGFRVNSKIDVTQFAFALELWTGVSSAACASGDEVKYGYILLPFIKGGTIGDVSVENGAINFSLANARTKDGNQWGAGPYSVTRGASNVAGPLNTVLDVNDHSHTEVVTVPPPTPTDDAVALGVPATGATAGSPGTYTPANSYGPQNLAGMSSVTASPTSAWTTGQYVPLGDGSRAKWNGTAWVAA